MQKTPFFETNIYPIIISMPIIGAIALNLLVPYIFQVRVTCECGHRYSTRVCIENSREYQRIATAQLASQMADLAAGQAVNISEVNSSGKRMYKT